MSAEACASLTVWTVTASYTRSIKHYTNDLIIIQGVNPKDSKANYPNSNIIVYQDPRYPNDPDENIVHRIVKTTEINGTLYFYTKTTATPSINGQTIFSSGEYDPWSPVSADLVYGKVIMRIPWIGAITKAMQDQS